jgi:phospholipase/carboxylesterase
MDERAAGAEAPRSCDSHPFGTRRRTSRREWLALGLGTAAALTGCLEPALGAQQVRSDARLDVRRRKPVRQPVVGRHALGLGGERDGEWFIPASYAHPVSAPLAVMLHGAGSRGSTLRRLHAAADRLGIVMLMPDSRAATWDAIRGRDFGADIVFLQRALDFVFERCRIDLDRIALGGFSDGATYALSVGLANGDLFTHVIAFSPGFVLPGRRRARPRVFVSHGTRDAVLPIERTSRVIVPRLKSDGYDVRYEEFDGPHGIPPAVEATAFSWFLGPAGS